jgi:hypothetical protein
MLEPMITPESGRGAPLGGKVFGEERFSCILRPSLWSPY